MYSFKVVDEMNITASNWTALGNDTDNLAASTTRLFGASSLEFDKVDGAGNTKLAGAYKTISLNLTEENIQPIDYIVWSVYVSATTDVDYALIRLGSDGTNYYEWRFADTSMSAGWSLCYAQIGTAILGGTGWAPAAVEHLEVGVAFDAQDDTLADIKVDRVVIYPAKTFAK